MAAQSHTHSKPLLGAHESVAGGLHLAFERIEKVGGEALQIFTRNQRQWNPAELKTEEIDLFKKAHEKSGGMPVASHASYLVNLASGKDEILDKSINNFVLELTRCDQLGVPYVVLHPGSHGGDGVEAGLERFTRGLDEAIERSGVAVQVLVETTAGQGTSLGSRLKNLFISLTIQDILNYWEFASIPAIFSPQATSSRLRMVIRGQLILLRNLSVLKRYVFFILMIPRKSEAGRLTAMNISVKGPLVWMVLRTC